MLLWFLIDQLNEKKIYFGFSFNEDKYFFWGGGRGGVGGKGEGICVSKLENYEVGYLFDE